MILTIIRVRVFNAWRLQIKQHVGCYIKTVEFDIKNLDHLNKKCFQDGTTYKDKNKNNIWNYVKQLMRILKCLRILKGISKVVYCLYIFEQEEKKEVFG